MECIYLVVMLVDSTATWKNTYMKRWKKLGIIALVSFGVILTALACVRHRYPVLLHLFSSCACTDYSDMVTGLTVFNPFRGRSPEASANRFFEDIKLGRCPDMAPNSRPADCKPNSMPFPFEWRLKNRQDQPHKILLYYQFTRFDDKPYDRWGSEGMAEVVEINGRWKVSSFDVIW